MKTPLNDKDRLSTIILVVILFITAGCARQSGGLKEVEYKPPTWLTHLPQKQGWLFAVGEAGPHYFNQKGWESAEENARENLAKTIQTRIKGEYISIEGMPGGRTKVDVSKETLDIALYGAQVLERYKDPNTKHYYVLVGISASNVAEKIIEQAKKALEEKEEIEREKSDEDTARAIRESKEEMIKKLEKKLEGKD